MAESKKIIEGLLIIQLFTTSKWFLQAEHDELFAGDAKLPPEDDAKVRALGFRRDDDKTDSETGDVTPGTDGLWSVYT